jgi:DNA repair protein RecN (Recombination protein N)
MKVASGGELSRFLLALKVVLADRGIGAHIWCSTKSTPASVAPWPTRSARGWRASPARSQVMAVTHAPQVAAHARISILLISKDALDKGKRIATGVATSERMITAARKSPACWPAPRVTEEARAQADQLLRASS